MKRQIERHTMISIPRLDTKDARILIKGARNKANEMGIPMCIAISDDSGNLITFERMDNAKAHSILIAQDKAYTGGAARKATHDYNEANVPGSLTFGIDSECGGRLSSVGGGYPILVNGVCLGGIGVSGGAPQQDMDVAQAAIEFFEKNS